MDYNGSVMKRVALFLIVAGAAVAMVACQGAVGKTGEPGPKGDPGDSAPPVNLAPFATTPFEPVMLVDEGPPNTIDVGPHFHDPEDEGLTFVVSVAPVGIVTATLEGSSLTIDPVAAGYAEVTVTATDPKDAFGTAIIKVTVSSEGIMYVGDLDLSVALTPGQQHIISGAEIEESFEEDEGEVLTFSVSSSDTSVALAEKAVDNMVTITALDAVGSSADVTITAMDDEGDTAPVTITVTVVESLKPQASDTTPGPVTLTVGDTEDVTASDYFWDPSDGDLMYTPISSSDAIATASVADGVVTITAVAAGDAVVTITATNSHGDASQTIGVTVNAAPVTPVEPPEITSVLGAQDFAFGDMVAREFMLSMYFAGATSYDADSSDDTVATATAAGEVLTVTPVGTGVATVTVTAENSGGSRMQTIRVEVAERPNMPPTVKKTLPNLRLTPDTDRTDTTVAAGSRWMVDDLNDYFMDPETAPLSFKVEITSQMTTAENDDDEAVELVTKPSGFSTTAQVDAIAVGTAMIKVTAIDSDQQSAMQTFEIRVVTTNTAPEVVSGAPALGPYTGANRLQVGDTPEKPIDNAEINDYFSDDQLATEDGDLLTFTVMYVATGTGDVTTTPGVLSGQTVVDSDKVVATATVYPETWDGDNSSGPADKFTVTVTPERKGDAHDILIVATDLAGLQAISRIPVQVNRPPLAEGYVAPDAPAGTKPLKLSDYTTLIGLSASQAEESYTIDLDGTSATDAAGYFHDDDGDTLVCRAVPSVTGDTAPAVITMGAANVLTVDPKPSFETGFVPMTVTVDCRDGWGTGDDAVVGEYSDPQSFTVSVTSASVH